MAKLGDVCRVIVDGDWIESKDQSENGIRLIQTGNIGIGEYLDKSNRAKYITPETFERLKCTEVLPGDILISRLPDPIGRACIVPKTVGKAITAVDCTVVRLETSLCDANYFVNYTQSIRYSIELSKFLAGTTRTRISRKNLEKIEIPLPSIDRQRKIAAQLDKVSDLIAKRRAQLDKLDLLVKSRFVEMFGDPVVNPHNLPTVEFGSVLTVKPQNGLYKPQSDYNINGEGTPILRIDGFYDGKVTDFSSLKRLRCSDEELQHYLLRENDIVINRVNSIEYLGKCGLIRGMAESTVYESNMMRLHVDESKFNVRYVVQLLCSQFVYNQILTRAKKSVNQASINQKDVQSLVVYMPSLEVQNKFAAFAEQVENMKSGINVSLLKLETLKKALMQEYFG